MGTPSLACGPAPPCPPLWRGFERAGGGAASWPPPPPRAPLPRLAPTQGQERCVWAAPGPGFDPALARLGAGGTRGEGNTKGSSNLNLTARPGMSLSSWLQCPWIPSLAGPGPAMGPPRDTSDTRHRMGTAQLVQGLGVQGMAVHLGLCAAAPRAHAGLGHGRGVGTGCHPRGLSTQMPTWPHSPVLSLGCTVGRGWALAALCPVLCPTPCHSVVSVSPQAEPLAAHGPPGTCSPTG